MSFVLVVISSLIYYAEHPVQPDKFPDIPTTMWFGIITMTTTGYGDMFPITPMGRLLTSLIALLGLGMFALPTGILGAGFLEELEYKKRSKSMCNYCPHCGKSLHDHKKKTIVGDNSRHSS